MDFQNYRAVVKNALEKNIYYHSLSLEACMGALYDYLNQNGQLDQKEAGREEWLLAALVHDIDYRDEFKPLHPTKTKEALAKLGLDISDTVDQIVKAHAPETSGVKPQSKAQWSIFCADSLTGLITAVALIYPSKKLAEVKVSSVVKRFLKEPRFAAGTRRDEVAMCQNVDTLNIPLEKFIELCLEAMKKIAVDIEL